MIFFNIPESNKETSDERKVDDTKHVKAISNQINCDLTFTNPIRLGKKSDKIRPLRITANSIEEKKHMLKSARNISRQDSVYSKVVIKPDMTPLQREDHMKLVKLKQEKVEEARAKGEDDNYIIRNGQVVLGRRRDQSQNQHKDR